MKHESGAGPHIGKTAGLVTKTTPGQVGVSSPAAHNQILLGPNSGLKSAFSTVQAVPGQPKPTKDILKA